jgi:hypothetical protein
MCDTMVVVGPDGVLFAKNSDRGPNEVRDVEPGNTRPFWARRYWQARNRRAGIPLDTPGITAAAS